MLRRGDTLSPAQVPALGKAETSYPTPNRADRLVIERVPIAPEKYVALPPHSPHPDYDNNGLFLVWQGKVKAENNQIVVVRVYSNDLANDDWYNFSIKYSGDVVATPLYVRSYIELREDYVALAKGSTLKTIMRLRVTAEGAGYTYGTPPTVTLTGGGASTQATVRAIMNPAGTKVIALELVTAGVGYTSNPAVGFSGGSGSGVTATAEIQPTGAVLVHEETVKLDSEDVKMASMFIRVQRIYEVLPGPWIPFTRYDNDLGPIQGYKRAVLNVGQRGGVLTVTKKQNFEGRDGSAIVLWEIIEYWSNGTGTPALDPDPGPGPAPLTNPNAPYPSYTWDEYKDERGAVQRTSQIVVKTGSEVATLNEAGSIWTKIWYEAYKDNPFLLEMFMETWNTVLVDDLRVTSEHGGAIYKHTERTAEPGVLSVETGYLIMDSKLVRISPDEQKLITDKFDPSSAVAVLELVQGGSGYGSAPAVGFSGGTCGTAPVATAVLGFGVASVTVNNGGSGFLSPPAIGFGNGGGGGGFAIAVLGFGVASVVIANGGSYTVAPTVAFTGDGTGATGNVVMGFGVYFATVTDPGGRAKGTLTSDNTNVANNDTVTIGTKVYTFKTALTPAEGEVLRGANADASLLNLIRAINHTGTPGTDYSVAVANAYVTAAPAVTAHAFQVTAKQPGIIRNTFATTESSAHLSWGAATLLGGFAYAEIPAATLAGDGAGAQAQVVMGSPVNTVTVDNRGTGFTAAPQVVGNGGGSGLDMLAVLGFAIDSINVTNPGTGFVSIPTVVIDPPDTGGIQAVAAAVMAFGIASATISNGGSGYGSAPAVGFGAGSGSGATGTAVLGFAVASASITNAGDGYTAFPSSSIAGGGGTGAAINIRMGVDTVTVLSAGTGYVVNDIVDVIGGTHSVVGQIRVTSVDGFGGITGASVETAGVYSAIAANPRTLTPGSAGSSTPYTLTFASVGDTNGALYLLGTNFGAVAWTNPHTAGRAVVTRSSDGGGTSAVDIVDRTTSNTYSDNLANSWVAIDLGAGNTLVLNKYAIQARNSGASDPRALRNWRMQGSNNAASNSIVDLAAATWTDIDVRLGDTTMANNDNEFVAYDGFSVPVAYRWIRILQDGVSSDGDNFLAVAEMEFYGGFVHATANTPASVSLTYKLVQVNVTAGGTGYTSAPTISIGTSIGTSATATSVLAATGSVKSVTITAPGSGYAANFALSFTGGGGSGAAGTAVLATTGGTVASINVTNPGRGYTVVPAVALTGGGGSGALATAVLETIGEVWRVDVINGGVWETTPVLSFIGGGGTGAAATAVLDLSQLHVHRLFIIASGRAYTTAPTISFLNADNTVPVDLAATATLLSAGEVVAVTISASGSGYTAAVPVFSGGVGSGAAGTAGLTTAGSVKSVAIVTPGLYKTVPAVAFIGGGGSGANGTAVLAATGSVVELLLLTPGSCTVAPTVTFTGSNTTLATALYHIGSDEWPINPGFSTDDIYGIVVDHFTQVVPTGRPHPGRAAQCLGNFIDQTVYDRWKSIRRVSKVNLSTLPCPEIVPARHVLRIPPRLISIEVVWTGGVSKLVAALESSSTVRVSSGANADVIVKSSEGFHNEVSGYGIREWFFGPPPLAYYSAFPIFNARGASGSVVVSATNSSTGQTQAGPGVSFNDAFQSQVHAVDIRDHLVGYFKVISTDIFHGAQRQLSEQTVHGGSDALVLYTSQSVSGFAFGPGGAVGIVAAGTPATMKVSIPASDPATMFEGSSLLVGILPPERWRFDVWSVTRIYVPTPRDL